MFLPSKPVFFLAALAAIPLLRGGADDEKLIRLMEQTHIGNAVVQPAVIENAPVLDGRLSPGEWDSAAVLSGFSSSGEKGQLLGNKPGQVFLQRTKDHLWIAVRTTTLNDSPGGGLVSNATRRDDFAIASEDTVELTFHNTSRPDEIMHLICNPGGACLDMLRDTVTKKVDIKWDLPGWTVKSRVESFWWVLEMKIPLAELSPAGSQLKFNVARNWCDTGTFSTLNRVKKYFSPGEMIRIDLTGSPVVVRQEELGNPDEGVWETASLGRNRSDRAVVFAVMLHEYAYKKVDGKVKRSRTVHGLEKRLLEPGEEGKLVLRHKTGAGTLVWFSTAVFDAKTRQVLYRRLVQGRKSLFTGRRPVLAAGEIKNTGRFRAYDYPGYGHAAFFFNFTSQAPTRLLMTGPDGAKKEFPIVPRRKEHFCRADVPSTPGVYTFSLPGGQTVCRIRRKHFEWLGNSYGKEKVILPPFTPIQTEGNRIDVIFRKHEINKFGLWNSIESKGTLLLAEHMSFELVVDGRTTTWQGEVSSPVRQNDGHDAVYTARARSSTGITLSVEGLAEYDGFFWNRFKLENPKGRTIDRLTLRIPLKNGEVPLYHVVSNSIRSNPAGYLPAGTGELWNGTKLARQLHFGQPVMHKQFVPYVWLGGVERGLCWFMDSSFGCSLSPVKPQVRIIRRGETVTLEVDIINVPDRSALHEFEFGLQATPVKPVHPRLLPMTRDGRGWVPAGLPNLGDFYQIRGGFPSQWATAPLGNDYTLYEKVIRIIAGDGRYKGNIRGDIEAYYRKYLPLLQETIDKDYPNISARIIKSACDAGALTDVRRPPSRPIMYTDPRLIYRYEEGAQAFKSEWWNPARISYTGAWRVTLTPSFQDYLVFHARKLLQLGLRGINLDDAFLMPDDNPETVARVDAAGTLHSNIGILQLRSYVKRLATLMHTEFKLYPRYVEPHMTNALIVPAFAFADGQLGLEQHYGESPRTECFSPGEILATYTGRQIGAKPLGLPGLVRRTTPLEKWKKDFPRLTRSCIALSLPFGITMRTSRRVKYEHFDVDTYHKFYGNLAEFGIAKEDCVFLPCYEQKAVTTEKKDLLIGCYRRPGKVLVCVSNFGRTPVTATLKIDAPALGLKDGLRMTDWETRRPVTPQLTLGPGDFRLILLEN